jgi:hypothetical protein
MRLTPVFLSSVLALAVIMPGCAPSESPGTGAALGSSGTDSLTFRYFCAAGWEILSVR